jgi:hypothetical protein
VPGGPGRRLHVARHPAPVGTQSRVGPKCLVQTGVDLKSSFNSNGFRPHRKPDWPVYWQPWVSRTVCECFPWLPESLVIAGPPELPMDTLVAVMFMPLLWSHVETVYFNGLKKIVNLLATPYT